MSSLRVLVLGGIRSGKSEYAETLVMADEDVHYLATGSSADADPTWEQRIAAHRERRPEAWTTAEFGADPYGLALRISAAGPGETLLVDDLGGWLNALYNLTGDWADPHAADDPVDSLATAVADCEARRLVLVSPEVGLSVVPHTEAGRTFADALGRLNRAIAAASDVVTLVVAGQPTWLKGGPRSRPTDGARHAADDEPAALPATPALNLAGTAATAEHIDGSGAPDIQINLSLPMPDERFVSGAAGYLASLDFAGAGLGLLAPLVSFAASTQGRAVPRPWEQARVLLLHALHEGGVAAGDDPEAAARRLDQAHEGTGPVALLAAVAGASAGTVGCPAAGPIEERDALTAEEVDEALALGWQLAEAQADAGADILVIAAIGVGSEAAAAAVTAMTAGGEPAALLDRVTSATGYIDDGAWMRRCAAVRDALHRVRARQRDPRTVLAAVGGGDIAVAAGIILGATFRKTPVVLDGPVGVAAALVARDFGAQTRHWLLVPDHGDHPTVRLAADVLGATQYVHLKLRLGEGTAALAALPLLNSALTLAAGTPTTPPPPLRHDSPRHDVVDFPTSEFPLVDR